VAIGDKAAAAGLAVYSSEQQSSKGYENDNQRGDELADLMGRTAVVEGAVNQPIFSVKRANTPAEVAHGQWTLARGAFSANPDIVEGMGWELGEVMASKAGIYRLTAGVAYGTEAMIDAGLQITRNSTEPNTTATILGRVTLGRTCETSGLIRLAAGDTLRLFVFQRNTDSGPRYIGRDAWNLMMSAEWVRS
jgi:hypothetical protein